MKKIFVISALITLIIFGTNHAVSQVRIKDNYRFNDSNIKFVAFYDYFPISSNNKCGNVGIFNELIDLLKQKSINKISPYCTTSYKKAVEMGAKKDADIILGMYSDNSLYDEWKIVYPAIIDNPVHLVMTPSRINQVKSVDDLTKLKGAISSHDHFNEYVNVQLKNFDITTFDNNDELFRKLITGEIDYIFITYWYGMAESIKLGITDMVSFSKRGVWTMPLFIGVSKMSSSRTALLHYLTEWISQDELRQKIKDAAFEALKQLAEDNSGTVPEYYNINKSNM